MKPTPQFSPNPRPSRNDRSAQRSHKSLLSSTDYGYQPTTEAIQESPAVTDTEISARQSFRKLSHDVFSAKTDREYLKEAAFFLGISCVAGWALSVMLHQLVTMMISPPPGGLW